MVIKLGLNHHTQSVKNECLTDKFVFINFYSLLNLSLILLNIDFHQ